jgi:hypothetical protein
MLNLYAEKSHFTGKSILDHSRNFDLMLFLDLCRLETEAVLKYLAFNHNQDGVQSHQDGLALPL